MLVRSLLLAPLVLLPVAQEADALRGLETFDAVWRIVATEHFDPDLNGVDWEAAGAELRPRAAEASDRAALRATITELLGRLGQSHFALIPAEVQGTGSAGSRASPAGTAGLDLRWMDGAAVVVEVAPGGGAEAAGARPGWQLTGIDGKGLEATVAEARNAPAGRPEAAIWRKLLGRIDGAVDSRVRLSFADAEGAEHELTVERRARDARAVDVPGLPTFFLTSHERRIERDGLHVGILGFSNWLRPLLPELDRALTRMRDCDGIVLDLRGNTGGDGTVATDLAGHFFRQSTRLGVMRTRSGERPFLVRPRGNPGGWRAEPYLGPLAIVVDETTGSSSEVFCGGMQSLGRARVFGTPTAGAALPANLTPLPNGDTLLHAVGEFSTANGTVLEGDGVQPDELTPRTRAAVLEGRDPALEAALAWIAGERGR